LGQSVIPRVSSYAKHLEDMKRIGKIYCRLFLIKLFFFLPQSVGSVLQYSPAFYAFAQGRGNVEGVVTSFERKEALSGATVSIQGTPYITTTDEKGKFIFENMPVGTYRVKVSVIGYITMEQTEVKVEEGKTTKLFFELKATEVPLKEKIVVIGERPVMDINAPATKRDIGKEEIASGLIDQMDQIIAQKAGVVEMDNQLHIRGARSYENLFLIEGVSIEDPYSTKGFGLVLPPSAIEEMSLITGGVEAEYGQVTSGVIDVKLKEASEKLQGSASYKMDHFGNVPFSFNSDILDLSLSGPTPFFSRLNLAGQSFFFFNSEIGLKDGYLKHANNLYSSTFGGKAFAPREDNRYSSIFKLDWRLEPLWKMCFTYGGSAVINQDKSLLLTRIRPATYSYGYPFEYQNILNNYNTFTQKSNFELLSLDRRFSVGSFLQLKLSRFFTNLHSDVNGKNWSEYVMPQDYEPLNIILSPDSSHYIVSAGDGFYDLGDGDTWYDHYVESYSLRGDYDQILTRFYRIKCGIYHQYQTLQLLDIYKPWLGKAGLGLNYDMYKVFANDGAIYFQNNFNFFDANLNLGARYEYWMPGRYVERAMNDTLLFEKEFKDKFYKETFSFFGRRAKGIFSPRIGFSASAGENVRFFFDYSHLAKKPNPQYVYAKLNSTSESTYQLFGNPNLNPERVVAYEVGLKFLLTKGDALSLVGYYRNLYDLITAVAVTPEGQAQNPYLMYFNLDYGLCRGIEIEYMKNIGKFFSGSIDLGISKSSGERSLPADILKGVVGRAKQALYQESNLDWDKPWQSSFTLSFLVDRRIRFFGLLFPQDWELNIRGWAQAGKRYTSYRMNVENSDTTFIRENENSVNNKIGKYWSNIDLNLQKHFNLKNLKYTIFCEVTNLFDRKNVTVINPLTGEEYKKGDIIPYGVGDLLLPEFGSKLPLWEDPARYLAPRNIKLGVTLSW
jgi:outer membrane receptor protein involved in Fe transport